MGKRPHYRVMTPASLLSACFSLTPNFPIRSVIGFLTIFGGIGLYCYLPHKEKKPISVYMERTRNENKKR